MKSKIEGSQLSTYRRIILLIRNPKDAFSLLSYQERQKDAKLVFIGYIIVRFPFLAQRYHVKGGLPFLQDTSFITFLVTVLILSAVVSFISIVIFAWILDVIINKMKKAGGQYSDMLVLVILCLAPQLLLVIEIPSVIMNFNSYESFMGFVIVRFVFTILTFRMLYWGIKSCFNPQHE